MAGASRAQLEKIKGLGKTKAAQIVAAFEIAKRLAAFHVERPKITAPSDVAGLMMSKMRYLTKGDRLRPLPGYERRGHKQGVDRR